MNIPNPYNNILQHMQTQGAKLNPPSIIIGIVISNEGEPLTINVGDLPLTKDNFLIADYLLKDYKRKFKVDNATATGTTDLQSVGDHGSHSHNITTIGIPDAELSFTDGLKKNDRVACLATSNEQIYIILCRVVSL